MKKYDIIVIGSALRDIFILNKDMRCKTNGVCHPFNPEVLGDKINVKRMYFDVGGGGTNSAATLANMRLRVGLLTRIGHDLAGQEVLKIMKKFGVDMSFAEVDKKEETGYSVIFIDQHGDRTALTFRGASDFRKIKKINPNKLAAKWFFITTLNGNAKLLQQIFWLARQKKIKIAWNPGNTELALEQKKLQALIRQADVIFLNQDEAGKLSGLKSKKVEVVFEKLITLSPKALWCVTGGKKGAWVLERSQIFWADILPQKVINATGAGDAFGSGFVAGLNLYHGDIKKSLSLAMLNANNVVTEMGAKHGILKKPPSEKMLRQITIKKLK